MDSGQLILDAVSRFAHVGTAIAVLGGSIFMRFVLMPAANQLPTEAHDQLRAAVLAKWKRFVHGGIAVFLLSGFYNYMRLMPGHKGDKLWHMLVGIKILLALVVFFLASALVGRSKAFEGLRQQRAKWLAIVVLLSLVIVGMSSFLKVRKFATVVTPTAAVGGVESATE